jgi:hypothetical protein
VLNTIFIKKTAVAVLLGSLVATPIAAMDMPMGCFERNYTKAHLSGQPAQVVESIRVLFTEETFDDSTYLHARMQVLLANQGHVRAEGLGGETLDQFLICDAGNGKQAPACFVECDGGGMQISRNSGGKLEFRTDYLMVGDYDECGGATDLTEYQGKSVTYRLNQVNDARCDDLRH